MLLRLVERLMSLFGRRGEPTPIVGANSQHDHGHDHFDGTHHDHGHDHARLGHVRDHDHDHDHDHS